MHTNDVGGAGGANGFAMEPEDDTHRAGATEPAHAVSARPQPGMMQQPPVQGGPKPPHVRWSRDLTNPFSFAEPSPVPVAVPVPAAAEVVPVQLGGTRRLCTVSGSTSKTLPWDDVIEGSPHPKPNGYQRANPWCACGTKLLG